VSPERARLLLADPAYDRLLPIADVTAKLDMRDEAASRMLAHPAHRDAQQLGYVGGGEETVAHFHKNYRGILAYIDDRPSAPLD
jgi:hypothetical protein